MTCTQMLPALGATVTVRFESILVVCIVRDVKTAYGSTRFQVGPQSGSGRQWVEISRLVLPTTDLVRR